MRPMRNKWKKAIVKAFQLPPDTLFDLPRATIYGHEQLYIENHKGIIHFTNQCLTFLTADGQMRISGNEMRIQSITMHEVWIVGCIHTIEYQNK